MLQEPSPRSGILKPKGFSIGKAPNYIIQTNPPSDDLNTASQEKNAKPEDNLTHAPKKSAISLLLDSVTSFKSSMRLILKKMDRTEEEAKTLYSVLKDYAFFKRFTEKNDELESNAAIYLCQNLRYETHKAGTVIFEQGDISNGKLYIVYSGTFSVFMHSDDSSPTKSLDDDISPKLSIKLGRSQNNSELTNSQAEAPKNKWNLAKGMLKTLATQNKNPVINIPTQVGASKNNLLSPMLKMERRNSKDKSNSPEGTPQKGNTPLTTPRKLSVKAEQNKTKSGQPEFHRKGSRKPSTFSRQQSMIRQNSNTNVDQNKAPSEDKFASSMLALKKLKSASFGKDFARFGKVIDQVEKGGFFGERAIHSNAIRAATIVANTDCELLIVTREVFEYLKSHFDKKKNKTLNFLRNCFPKIETLPSRKILENLLYLFEEKDYNYGSNIVHENEPGEKFYLLFEGQCELIKTITINESNFKHPISDLTELVRGGKTTQDKLVLSKIEVSNFFGEEILFHKPPTYQFTVRVCSTKATVLAVDKSKFALRFPRTIFHGLKACFLRKNKTHAELLKQLLSTKHKEVEIETSDIFKPDHEQNIEILQSPIRFKTKLHSAKPYYNGFKTPFANRIQLSKEIMEVYKLNTEGKSTKTKSHETSPKRIPDPKIIEPEESRIKDIKNEFLKVARDEVPSVKKKKKLVIENLVAKRIEASLNKQKTEGKITPFKFDTSLKKLHTRSSSSDFRSKINAQRMKPVIQKLQFENPNEFFLTSVSPSGDILNAPPQSLSARNLSNTIRISTASGEIRSPRIAPISSRDVSHHTRTWSEFYSGIIKSHPHIRVNNSNIRTEATTDDIDEIKVDLGRPEHTIEQKYKVIKMKLGLCDLNKGSPKNANHKRAVSAVGPRFNFLNQELTERFHETLVPKIKLNSEHDFLTKLNLLTPIKARNGRTVSTDATEPQFTFPTERTEEKDDNFILNLGGTTSRTKTIREISNELKMSEYEKSNPHAASLRKRYEIKQKLFQPTIIRHAKSKSYHETERVQTARF